VKRDPVLPETRSDDPSYGEHEKDRVWAHRLHEDFVLSDRQNFFLVAQALLVVAQAELLTGGERLGAAILAAVGVLLTAVWLYVGLRHHKIIAYVQRRAVTFLPEFADTYEYRPPGPGSTSLFISAVPGLLGVVWIVLFILAVA
jgi:hypothetical protein